MKTMRIALSATAVSVMVVAAFEFLEQGPLPAPSPAPGTTKPGTQLPVFVPGTLVASPTRLSIEADSGVRTAVTFSASYTGTGGVLDVQSDLPTHIADPAVTPLGDGRFSITLQTSGLLAEGAYRGTLRLRMCADAGCTNPVAGATGAVQYTLRMRWVNPGEWETFQRDAGHRGYVPVVIDPMKIRKAWEWALPTHGSLQPVATSAGHVYVAEAYPTAYHSSLYKLREQDGTEAWRLQFPDSAKLSSPAVSGGNVYLGVAASTTQARLFGYRDVDAAPLFQSIIALQQHLTMPPVVSGNKVYVGAGQYGGSILAYDGQDGTPLWSRTSGNEWHGVPAVDGALAYHYASPEGLQVYAKDNGDTVASIADPLGDTYSGSYLAGPVLGAEDEVFALSGNSGYARFIVAYAPSTNSVRWTSSRKYVGVPAYKDGVLYAGSVDPIAFDAIDAATGTRLWSWVPGPATTNFRGNIIVTRNLVFVSTNAALHAIDLQTRQSVWSIPLPGTIAMSGEGTLYVLPFPVQYQPTTPPKLLAYRLR